MGPASHVLNQGGVDIGFLVTINYRTWSDNASSPGDTCSFIYAYQSSPASNFPQDYMVAVNRPTAVYYALTNCQGQAYMPKTGCVGMVRWQTLMHPAAWLDAGSTTSSLWAQDGPGFSSVGLNSSRGAGNTCTNISQVIRADVVPVSDSGKKIDLSGPWTIAVF